MAVKLVTRNKATVTVKGTMNDEDGRPVKFDFILYCKRLDQDEIEAVLDQHDKSIKEFLRQVVTGWASVIDADNQPVPFNAETFELFFKQPGIGSVAFTAYLKEVGAKEKN